jgi:DNA (cytosine-5)-methyltransferase 1
MKNELPHQIDNRTNEDTQGYKGASDSGSITREISSVHETADSIGDRASMLGSRAVHLQSWFKDIQSEKPSLRKDSPIGVCFFSGGGGVETGWVMAGIRPAIAVEFDPTKPELSARLADQHDHNFKEYGCKVIRRSVQDMSCLNFPGIPRNPDFLHASPVCSNFSQMKPNGEESDCDRAAAESVAHAIAVLAPKVFTLEQVTKYESSLSWSIILNQLLNDGYQVTSQIVNFADYGVPQKERKRLIAVACKTQKLELPAPTYRISWWDAIADLVPHLPESNLNDPQQNAIADYLSKNEPCPLLVPRVGYRGDCKAIPFDQQAKTLVRSLFTDQRGNPRSRFMDIWLPSGEVKQVTVECCARLQAFPDWYDFTDAIAVSGSSIGYSVPPLFSKLLFESILKQMKVDESVKRHHLDFYESPWWFTTEMCKYVPISGTVLEPCVGGGAIAEILKHHPAIAVVATNDIDDNKQADYHFDVTLPESWEQLPECDWVVTNPPFADKAAPIVINAFKKAKKGVAMFLLSSFLEPCCDRADFLAENPPNIILSFPRYCFRKDKDGKRWTTDNQTINCFVWIKGITEQRVVVLPPEKIEGFYKNPGDAIDIESAIALLTDAIATSPH